MSQLTETLLYNFRKYQDKVAVISNNSHITYGKLEKHVKSIISFWNSHGGKRGDRIGVVLPNCIEFVEIMLAAAFMDCAIVPISASLPINAVRKAFDSVGIDHIIGSKFFWKKAGKAYENDLIKIKVAVGGVVNNIVSYNDCLVWGQQDLDMQNVGDVPFIFTLTSGSTGMPKPIVLTQNNKYYRSISTKNLYGLTNHEVILAGTPLYHSLAERLVILPLLLGGTSVILPKFSVNEWFKAISENKVTFTIAVSSQLNSIVEALDTIELSSIKSLRCLVSSSALLEEQVKEKLMESLQCEFHEIYGTSEIAVATDIDFRESCMKRKSVGKAIPEAHIKIIDSHGKELDANEVGQIVCKSSLTFEGYYKLPDMTKESFWNGYFKTGDMGYLDKDGYLYFQGREKEIIITGGVNVYPMDVEEIINTMDSVEECVAFAFPDNKLGEVVAVAVVVKEGKTFNEREAKFLCIENLADYQQPHKFFAIDEIPKNGMGKVVRYQLREQLVRGEKRKSQDE